jgi:hypothetical protein
MNLLDEQVRADQRLLLSRWRIPFRQIGRDIAESGIKDENIIPFLHRLKRPTLFTHDEGFFSRQLVHPAYSLVWLDTSDVEAALYIRRFLKHSSFSTTAKRMGVVARVHHDGVHFWQHHRPALQTARWMDKP